ncbi:SRPBCC family protein [Kitasatospora sp. NPDC086009]|uniref:SRPBCC family protein n=1 Tax=unclassified Kitasatospora TaxID=2633591 RepID=UPI0037CA4E39
MSTATREDDPFETVDAADFAFTRRAWVDAAPALVYDLVGDVSANRRWSPDVVEGAFEAAFDQDAGPRVGAWFSGRNRRDGKEWTTRSQIVRAVLGAAFAFVVGGAEDGIVRWSWTFRARGRGTVVRQSWQLLRLAPVLGSTRGDLAALRDRMADSVEATLAALAQWIAEGGPPRDRPRRSPELPLIRRSRREAQSSRSGVPLSVPRERLPATSRQGGRAGAMGFEGEVWRLMRQEELLGEIVIDESEFPWLYGRFAPTAAFGAVKPWFDESLALVEAEEFERFDDSYDRIAAALTLLAPSGLVAEFLLHINDGRAWLRWSDEPFDAI